MPDVEVLSARSPADWQAILEICWRTGSDGEPITDGAADARAAFTEKWVGPYAKFLPTWSYVAHIKDGGRVLGYLTGCPDTAAFPQSPKTPIASFSKAAQARLLEYPAHLHVNLLKECRGKGIGKLLIERFCYDLVAHRVAGAHVFCGKGPVRFYEGCGFKLVEKIVLSGPNAKEIFALARRARS